MQNFLVKYNVHIPKTKQLLKFFNHFTPLQSFAVTCKFGTRAEAILRERWKRRQIEEHLHHQKEHINKWTFLEHNGPVFPGPYQPLPDTVKFYYNGKQVKLSPYAEEVAGYYAKLLDHDYVQKEVFNSNFFKDWRDVMCDDEKRIITNLKCCDFKEFHDHFKAQAEFTRMLSRDEKLVIKRKAEKITEKFGYCNVDGREEKILNFKIEPPGLFRGRGDHPKMGMLKKRIQPEDVTINCSQDSVFPRPPRGHKWKEIRHDSSVMWLASWTENIDNKIKYIVLNPASVLRSENDLEKFETAAKLHKIIGKIRRKYRKDWTDKNITTRQRGVALYFIDKLALRTGTQKDDESVDTVGCCSLRVEHITLINKEHAVVFDFLGKDSIRYHKKVPVERIVFKNLKQFVKHKKGSDLLFDKLNTKNLNRYLNRLMPRLTAKVFRTYNASLTLQKQLKRTSANANIDEKMLSYNRANRAVALLCNHQRTVPKCYQRSMEKLNNKINEKRKALKESCSRKKVEMLRRQLSKLEMARIKKTENKCVHLGTSKMNYLDPRISVAWCKKYNVPIESIYTKSQREKFRWAIEKTAPDFQYGKVK